MQYKQFPKMHITPDSLSIVGKTATFINLSRFSRYTITHSPDPIQTN
jgi:hypothetical protein